MAEFTKKLTENLKIIDKILQPQKSFDLIRRDLIIGERDAALYFIDGFIKDEVFEKILEFLFKIKAEELQSVADMRRYLKSFMPYVEVDTVNNPDDMATAVLSGPAVLLIDGISGALVIDVREYPTRSVGEPDKDRSLRGSRDGFLETLIFNTALLRRRIRDPRLRMEHFTVGSISKVDVALSYLNGEADEKLLQKLRAKLKSIELGSISMTAEALAEKLVPTAFFNPFPKVRYTERPDYASASVMEGKVLLLMDNSPLVMIFPTCFADFSREADDYNFPRLTGSYIRILRIFISVFTVILTPATLLFINNPSLAPEWLKFVIPKSEAQLPIFVQLLLLEFIVDGLRLASLNTPDSLSSSLGIIGGLLLSEFAVKAGWFVSEAILYMAFVAIASYTQPSFEMGYAMKFIRILTLVLTQLLGLAGFILGLLFGLSGLVFSKTLSGRGYFYPIIPFDVQSFIKLFIRTKIKH